MSSQFLSFDLGNQGNGDIVEVNLTAGANVRLMDSSNFSSYKSGRSYRCGGGLAPRTPVRLVIPHSGHWYVVVDMQGLRGSTRASVRMLPKPMQAMRPLRDVPMSSVPSLVRSYEDIPPANRSDDGQVFDVFISHASEDKEEVVRPLAIALQYEGLKVWYDEFELRIGDSLRRKIDKGLSSSRFGIVVLSQAFLGKGWPEYELDGLITKANSGEQILLPVWHGISKQQVIDYSPSLADKVARNTATHTVQEIAVEIASLIKPMALAAV